MLADNRRALALSEQLRKRWNVALSHMEEIASSSNKAQAYDEAFWGTPEEWTAVTEEEDSLANLLFPIKICAEKSIPVPHGDEVPPSVFVEIMDGFYSVYNHSNDPSNDWKNPVSLEPFDIKKVTPRLNEFSYCKSSADAGDAFWIISGAHDDLCAQLTRGKRHFRVEPGFPDMLNVNVHVDLSWDCLRIAFSLEEEENWRIICLPKWGLRSWTSSVFPNISLDEDFAAAFFSVLIHNSPQTVYLPQEDKEMTIYQQEINAENYIGSMFNLLPKGTAVRVRMTGWLAAPVFRTQLENLKGRFASLVFEPSYQMRNYV